MNKKIKVAIIGVGRIGMLLELDKKRVKPASHFGMWNSNRKVSLEAICDEDTRKIRIAKKLNKKVQFFTDAKKMLTTIKPDIVSISTWKNTHFKFCKLCIENNIKTIVLEKPLANTLNQSKILMRLINKNKTKVLVNHRRRFDEQVIKLKKLIKSGKIGKINQVSCFYVYGLLTTGTHVVDTLRMLLKDIAGEVIKVIGIENNNNDFTPKDDKNYDAILFFRNGLKVCMQSLNIKDYDIFDFYFYGSKGKISFTGIGRTANLHNIIQSPEHTNFTELNSKSFKIFGDKPRKQFRTLSENAIQCLLNKKTLPLCTAEDSFIDMKIIEAIKKSANNNSKITYIK